MDKGPSSTVEEVANADETASVLQMNSTHKWQRISPIALIYFVLMFIKNIFGNFIYVAPALFILYNKAMEDPSFWLPIAYGLSALLGLASLLSYYFFQYRLTNQQIEIRSGVFAKKYVNLPFSRIQNVELTEPLYYRPFGYACMQLDTAGSTKQEAKVVALKKSFAQQLKHEILAAHLVQAEQVIDASDPLNENLQATAPATEDDETVLDRRNLDDLVIHGLTNNRVWIFLGGLAPFIDKISSEIGEWLMIFGINVNQYFEFEGRSGWQIASTVFSTFLIIMLIISIFSVLGSIIAFHDFKLSKIGDRYIRRSGLFTKTEVTMRLSRLQMIVCQQDWLDILLRRINLKFEQSNANFNNPQAGQLTNKIIVPSVTNKECQHLMLDAYPDNQLTNTKFKRVHPRLLVRNIFLFLLPLSSLVAWVFVENNNIEGLPYLGAGVTFIGFLMVMRYLRWGYAKDDNFIYVRRGVLGVDYFTFPIYKVQQTTFKQSWFLKRKQLCSIEFVLAAGAVNVPYLSEKDGLDLINTCLYEVEEGKRNWM